MRSTRDFGAADVGYTLTTTEQWTRRRPWLRGFAGTGRADRPGESRIIVCSWLNRIGKQWATITNRT